MCGISESEIHRHRVETEWSPGAENRGSWGDVVQGHKLVTRR